MTWHYILNEQQKGPVQEPELQRLVQQGVITGATLVWRDGMPDWKPYNEIATPHPPVPGVGAVVCAECGHSFAPDQVIRIGSGYVCARCKPVAMQKLREGVTGTEAEAVRREYIAHEASVKSVGLLYLVAGGLIILGGAMATLAAGGRGALAALIFLALGGAQLSIGISLRRLKPWGRIGAGILSGIGLLGFPLGTLINGYILYLLFSRKGAMVFSEEYREVIEQTPHVKYRTSIVLWILLALILALLLALALPALVRVHR